MEKPKTIYTQLSGIELLKAPLLNKDTGFTDTEREAFALDGLLPPHVETLEQQVNRCYEAYLQKNSDIEKHIYLRSLQDRNETLFYALIRAHLTEMMPIIYTPVVGDACKQFSHIYRQPRGLFIAYPKRDKMETLIKNFIADKDIQVIVVTDGERILGLGDQGVDGMGIPIGKLSLYTACGGICPSKTLPIMLDVGTNNIERRHDPDYLGWRHERITGEEYDAFIEKFVFTIKKLLPHVLLQFEDFAQSHAYPILEQYRQTLCTFNDDIQGTAAVSVATILAACKVAKVALSKQRIVVVGAGSAGCGISEMLIDAMVEEGLDEQEARKQFYLVDRSGLLEEDMAGLLNFQRPFAKSKKELAQFSKNSDNVIGLYEVVSVVHPSILIGVSGQAGLFSQMVIESMAQFCDRPMIFPLSNPTSKCEARPDDLIAWSNGKALIATGSPFNDVIYNEQRFIIAQSNNSYIFPGLGLGCIAVNATFVSDEMFMAASLTLSELSPALKNEHHSLLPPLSEIQTVSKKIAYAVATEAVRQGHAKKRSEKEIKSAIDKTFWEPQYLSLLPKR